MLEDDDYYTLKEAAKVLLEEPDVRRIKQWIKSGELKAERRGLSLRIPAYVIHERLIPYYRLHPSSEERSEPCRLSESVLKEEAARCYRQLRRNRENVNVEYPEAMRALALNDLIVERHKKPDDDWRRVKEAGQRLKMMAFRHHNSVMVQYAVAVGIANAIGGCCEREDPSEVDEYIEILESMIERFPQEDRIIRVVLSGCVTAIDCYRNRREARPQVDAATDILLRLPPPANEDTDLIALLAYAVHGAIIAYARAQLCTKLKEIRNAFTLGELVPKLDRDKVLLLLESESSAVDCYGTMRQWDEMYGALRNIEETAERFPKDEAFRRVHMHSVENAFKYYSEVEFGENAKLQDLDKQREVLYDMCVVIFSGGKVDTFAYVEDVLSDLVSRYIAGETCQEDWDLHTLATKLNGLYPCSIEFASLDIENLSSYQMREMVLEDARERLEERKREWEERTEELKKRGLARTDGADSFEEAERRALLSSIKSRWSEHPQEEEKPPEDLDSFWEMERGLREDYVTYIYRIENLQIPEETEIGNLSYSGGGEEPSPQPKTPRKNDEELRPNDPCPCGSGKKYKKCHGQLDASPLEYTG